MPRKVKGPNLVAIDFFCGAGGLTRGLINAGINVKAGIEIDGFHQRTYEKNNYPAKFINKDIRQVTLGEIKDILGTIPNSEILLAACAPCQPFSKQRRNINGKGRTLLGEFLKIVEGILPGYVFIENVPGLKKKLGKKIYQSFINRLIFSGYKVTDGIVDAKDFGVPQTRRRLILIASRISEVTLPIQLYGLKNALLPYLTVKDAIGEYPSIKAGEKHPTVPNHWSMSLSPTNLERLKHTPKNGGNRLNWPKHLVLKCHRKTKNREIYKGHTDVYGRMKWDRPAPALTCKCVSLSNGRYGHPVQNRAISLREAAKLQSFDDDYIFYGDSKQQLAKQVGNAVPVKLAEEVGKHFVKLWKENMEIG